MVTSDSMYMACPESSRTELKKTFIHNSDISIVFKICLFCINTVFPATLRITEGSLQCRNRNALEHARYGLLNGVDWAVVPSFHNPLPTGEEEEVWKSDIRAVGWLGKLCDAMLHQEVHERNVDRRIVVIFCCGRTSWPLLVFNLLSSFPKQFVPLKNTWSTYGVTPISHLDHVMGFTRHFIQFEVKLCRVMLL